MVRKFLLVLFLLLGTLAVGAAQGDVGTTPNSVAAKVFLFPDRLLQQHRLSAGRPHVSLPPTTPLFPDETFPAVKPYKYAGKEVDFVRFLLDSDLKQDALALVRQGGFFPSDTLDYLCGKVYFSVRELDAAAQAFSTLHPSSPLSTMKDSSMPMRPMRTWAVPRWLSGGSRIIPAPIGKWPPSSRPG